MIICSPWPQKVSQQFFLQLSPPPSPLTPIKSRTETFWYQLTRLHLKIAVRTEKERVFLQVFNRIPSNLPHSVRDQCLAVWLNIIHFTSRMYAHYLVKFSESMLWQNDVISCYFSKNLMVKMKTVFYLLLAWGTGIRGLMRGMATLPQGNQELLVVRDKVGRPQVSKSMECDIFPSVLWHCWLGDRKGIRPVKKLDVGLLVVIWLELCMTYSSSSPAVTTISIIVCFNKHRQTQIHPENGRECVCS